MSTKQDVLRLYIVQWTNLFQDKISQTTEPFSYGCVESHPAIKKKMATKSPQVQKLGINYPDRRIC